MPLIRSQLPICRGYEGLEPDESWKPNVAYGYELDYHENIGALYGTYSLDMKRGSVHIGLRGEYTQTSNETERRTRKYWDWFPHIDGNFYSQVDAYRSVWTLYRTSDFFGSQPEPDSDFRI